MNDISDRDLFDLHEILNLHDFIVVHEINGFGICECGAARWYSGSKVARTEEVISSSSDELDAFNKLPSYVLERYIARYRWYIDGKLQKQLDDRVYGRKSPGIRADSQFSTDQRQDEKASAEE